jgi:paraquat-inducible protein B
MDFQSRPLLKSDTRFWVVTARVGLGNITGLDTLLSGAYIQMAPGAAGAAGARSFTALPQPPLTPADAPGIRLHLLSDRAASVGTGDAVLYKGYQVGRVESAEFHPAREKMRDQLFVDAPFHELVDSSVRFWNSSGISLSAGADGLKLRTGSLDTVLLGGVAFGRPPDIPPGGPVDAEAEFLLYESYEATLENPYVYGMHFVARFSQSLKGLLPGAPVEYRGIPVGRVERILINELIKINIDKEQRGEEVTVRGEAIPVLLYVEPGKLGLADEQASVEVLADSIVSGVRHGLRATLETGNFLSGAKYVGIDYFPDVEAGEQVGNWEGYTEIPTIGGGIEQMIVKINAILDQVNSAPLTETIANANAAIVELEKALAGLQVILNDESTARLPASLNATLETLQATLDGMSPNSELYQNLNASMRQLNRALDNVESLTRTLSSQPNAVIMPARLPADPQPQASQ